eukprot:gene15441-19602_t
MSLFAEYEQDFKGMVASIIKRCGKIPDLDGAAKAEENSAAEREVDDARELLEQMDLEVINEPSSSRGKTKTKIADFKKELDDAERQLRRSRVAMSNSQTARDELFDFDGSTDDARESLLSNTEVLDRTSNRLEAGHRAALETQEVGMGILENLGQQREQIERSRARLRNANTPLQKASRLLGAMKTRAYGNKALSICIICTLLGTIILIIILIVTGSK